MAWELICFQSTQFVGMYIQVMMGKNVCSWDESCPYMFLEGNRWKLESISMGKNHIRFWKAIGGNLKVFPLEHSKNCTFESRVLCQILGTCVVFCLLVTESEWSLIRVIPLPTESDLNLSLFQPICSDRASVKTASQLWPRPTAADKIHRQRKPLSKNTETTMCRVSSGYLPFCILGVCRSKSASSAPTDRACNSSAWYLCPCSCGFPSRSDRASVKTSSQFWTSGSHQLQQTRSIDNCSLCT
jgi:hypothetical protein